MRSNPSARRVLAAGTAMLVAMCLWPATARAVSAISNPAREAEKSERERERLRRHRDPIYRQQVLELPLSQALKIYQEVLSKLQAHYVDRDKAAPTRLFRQGLQEFGLALDDRRFLGEYISAERNDAVSGFRHRLLSDWGERVARDAAMARKFAGEVALEAQKTLGLKPAIVVFELLYGACSSLDEHTAYLHPGRLVDESASLLGALADIGLQVEPRDRELVIAQVAAGSPAAIAGLKIGDRITRIDQKQLNKLPAAVVAALVAGEPGSAVELQIVPGGATNPVNFKLVRQSVFYRMLERKDGSAEEGIGYVQLIGFQKTTVHELEEAILRLKRDGGMRALILDLRGNPGGSFRVAVQVAERFLADGVIVSAQSQLKTYNRTFESRSGPNAIDIPLIVLIDGDTASAAELLAGALKENHRALLIGTTTYGKGTIQAVLPLHNLPAEAPAALRLTLARFFSPRGHAYNDTGVTPDRLVLDKDGQLQIALQEAAQLISLLP